LDLQLADVCLSSHTCTKPNVSGSFIPFSFHSTSDIPQVVFHLCRYFLKMCQLFFAFPSRFYFGLIFIVL
jgi:hypothetical protein